MIFLYLYTLFHSHSFHAHLNFSILSVPVLGSRYPSSLFKQPSLVTQFSPSSLFTQKSSSLLFFLLFILHIYIINTNTHISLLLSYLLSLFPLLCRCMELSQMSLFISLSLSFSQAWVEVSVKVKLKREKPERDAKVTPLNDTLK